jgi:hypothetical protein
VTKLRLAPDFAFPVELVTENLVHQITRAEMSG